MWNSKLVHDLYLRYPIVDGEPRRYGIRRSHWQRLYGIFRAHPALERVILYGSRAKGTNKPYSDVDITLVGDTLTDRDLGDISLEVDDLLLPFFFDISLYHRLTGEAFIASVNRTGRTVYDREKDMLMPSTLPLE